VLRSVIVIRGELGFWRRERRRVDYSA